MTAPQGLILFPGINTPLSATFTLAHGISPSGGTIRFAWDGSFIPKVGPLTISYGPSRITLPDCTVDKVEFIMEESGHKIYAAHILDRRWKWKYGSISGYYNVRRGTGEPPPGAQVPAAVFGNAQSIVPATAKTPQELAKLCFDAMGEKRCDVSQLPNDTYPEIEWDFDNPAEALARLCDGLNCHVVLHLDNTVSIEPVGHGEKLPKLNLMGGGIEADTPERPDTIVVRGARTRVQMDLDLYPVGREAWGEIKPIDDLSYAPALPDRWRYADVPAMNCVSNRYLRTVAQECVWRWYRIRPGFTLKAGDEAKIDIETLDQILPIEDRQISMYFVDGRPEPLPAWCYGPHFKGHESPGVYIDGQEKPIPHILGGLDWDLVKFPEWFVNKPFAIDRERGIVMFSEPVYDFGDGGEKVPAAIRLRVAFSFRLKENRAWVRPGWKRKLAPPRAGTKERNILRDDVEHKIVFDGNGAVLANNIADCEQQAAGYLDAYEAQYTAKEPASGTYAGFAKIDPDGAIQQVTWSVSEDGFSTTRATRCREDLLLIPSHAERRQAERLRATLAAQEATARQQAETLAKGRA